jgi:hypothetical protein
VNVETVAVPVTTTGSAGSATGTGRSPSLNGFLLDIYFDFAAAPSTTDTTVAFEAGSGGGTILTLTNTNTDVLHAPRKNASDNAGTAITGVYDCYPLNGVVTVALAQCDALAPAVTAYIRYMRLA